jgi:hypothetical protein
MAAVVLGFVLLFDGGEDVTPTAVINRAVGGSFIVCGLIAWQRRPDTRTGALLALTGFLYLGAQLLGESASPAVYTLSEAIAIAWLVPFAALVLGYPSGRLSAPIDRLLVGGLVLGAIVWQVVWLLFLPFPPGRENVLLIWPDAEAADAIDTAQRTFNTTIATGVAVVGITRWLRAAAAAADARRGDRGGRPRRAVLLPPHRGRIHAPHPGNHGDRALLGSARLPPGHDACADGARRDGGPRRGTAARAGLHTAQRAARADAP